MEAVDARETRDALRTFLLEEFDQFVFTVALIPKRKNPCVLLSKYVEKMKGIPFDFLFFRTLYPIYTLNAITCMFFSVCAPFHLSFHLFSLSVPFIFLLYHFYFPIPHVSILIHTPPPHTPSTILTSRCHLFLRQ